MVPASLADAEPCLRSALVRGLANVAALLGDHFKI
jgi:hypothetical protein